MSHFTYGVSSRSDRTSIHFPFVWNQSSCHVERSTLSSVVYCIFLTCCAFPLLHYHNRTAASVGLYNRAPSDSTRIKSVLRLAGPSERWHYRITTILSSSIPPPESTTYRSPLPTPISASPPIGPIPILISKLSISMTRVYTRISVDLHFLTYESTRMRGMPTHMPDRRISSRRCDAGTSTLTAAL